MAYGNESPFTLTAGEALLPYRLVKLSASTAVYADAGDEPVGVLAGGSVASGADAAIYALNGNLRKVVGNGVIAAGSAIYAAADGKVSDSAVGKQLGITMTAVSADGGIAAAIIWGPRGGNDALSAKGSVVEFFDDFFLFDDTATVGRWTAVADSPGAGALADGAGGLLNLVSGATDNNELYLASQNEAWKFAADKMLFFEARVKLTEAATDDANWIIGLSDTVGADSLLNDGAGPMASYDGAAFFKVDGTMKIQFESSNAATQVTDAVLATFASATWYKIGFLFNPNDGTTGKITPFVDGVAGTVQDIALAGLEEMHILMGVKAGGAHAETLVVDYVHCVQLR